MSETGPNPEQANALEDLKVRFRYLGFYQRIEQEYTDGLIPAEFSNLRLISKFLANEALIKAQKVGIGNVELENGMLEARARGEGIYKTNFSDYEEKLDRAESWIRSAMKSLLDFDSYNLEKRGQAEAAYRKLGNYPAIQFLAHVATKQTITKAMNKKGATKEDVRMSIEHGRKKAKQFMSEKENKFSGLASWTDWTREANHIASELLSDPDVMGYQPS